MEDNHSSVQGRDSAGISYCYKNMGLDEFGSVEILNLKERITFEYSIRDGILIQIKRLDPWKILLDYANGSFYIYDDNKTKYKNLLENLDRASIVDNYDELEEIIFLYCVEAYGISESKGKFCLSPELREISVYGKKEKKLSDYFCTPAVEHMSLSCCDLKTMKGIAVFSNLRTLELIDMNYLVDISQIIDLSNLLKKIKIINGHKIRDFSVLEKLTKLKSLELSRANKISNVDFLYKLENLQSVMLDVKLKGNAEKLLPGRGYKIEEKGDGRYIIEKNRYENKGN